MVIKGLSVDVPAFKPVWPAPCRTRQVGWRAIGSPGTIELTYSERVADDIDDRVDDGTDRAALAAANATFYHALETGDLELMDRLWSDSDDVSCAHPGRAPIVGAAAVRASWSAIFAAGGNPQIIATEERVILRGNLGWVTITENLISGVHTGAASAINVFEYDGDRWRMVAHHAAPVLAPNPDRGQAAAG